MMESREKEEVLRYHDEQSRLHGYRVAKALELTSREQLLLVQRLRESEEKPQTAIVRCIRPSSQSIYGSTLEILCQWRVGAHPHILKLRDVVPPSTCSCNYLVALMEGAQGSTLNSHLKSARGHRRARMPLRLALLLFKQLVLTLHFCHSVGAHTHGLHARHLLLCCTASGSPVLKICGGLTNGNCLREQLRAMQSVEDLLYVPPEGLQQWAASQEDRHEHHIKPRSPHLRLHVKRCSPPPLHPDTPASHRTPSSKSPEAGGGPKTATATAHAFQTLGSSSQCSAAVCEPVASMHSQETCWGESSGESSAIPESPPPLPLPLRSPFDLSLAATYSAAPEHPTGHCTNQCMQSAAHAWHARAAPLAPLRDQGRGVENAAEESGSVWAAGVVLYQMVHGTHPFEVGDEESVGEWVARVHRMDIQWPAKPAQEKEGAEEAEEVERMVRGMLCERSRRSSLSSIMALPLFTRGLPEGAFEMNDAARAAVRRTTPSHAQHIYQKLQAVLVATSDAPTSGSEVHSGGTSCSH